MKIMPVTNFRPNSHQANIKFTSDIPYDEYPSDFNPGSGCGSALGIGAIILGSIAFTLFGLEHCTGEEKEVHDEFIKETVNVIKSDTIKKDALLLKDVTGDENPDFVLYGKDGSKTIINVADREISKV